MKRPEQRYIELYKEMADLCEAQGWGDPFSYARSKEVYASIELGHKVASTLSGADGFNQKNEPCEYKSTIAGKVKGSYTGISVQETWDKQVEYLKKEKIGKYPEHYFNRFAEGKLVESWRLTGQQVLDILIPKLQKKFPSVLTKKDPRLSADVSNGDILKHGIRVI